MYNLTTSRWDLALTAVKKDSFRKKNPKLLNIFVHSVGGKSVVSILLSVSVSLAG